MTNTILKRSSVFVSTFVAAAAMTVSAQAEDAENGATIVEQDGLLQLASGSMTLSDTGKEVSSLAVGQFGPANYAYDKIEAAAGESATMTVTGSVVVNACYYTKEDGTKGDTTEIWVGKAHNSAESPEENSEAFKLIVDGGTISYKGDVDLKVVNTGAIEIKNGGSVSSGVVMIRNKVSVDGSSSNFLMTTCSVYGETGVTANVSLTDGAAMSTKLLSVGHNSNAGRTGTLSLADASSLDVSEKLTIYSGEKNGVTLNDSTLKAVALENHGTLAVLGTSELTTGELTLASGSETTIGSAAKWNAERKVSVASGATLSVDVSSAASNIVFSENATLALESGATLNLVLGNGDLQLNTIYLSDVFGNATISVGDAVAVQIMDGSGTVLAQSTVTQDASGNQVIVIPEPSAFGLLAGIGALALVAARRRRKS